MPDGYSDRTPALGKAAVGSYLKSGVKSKSGITLQFKIPRGTQEVDIQVAGHPNARGIALSVRENHGASYNIAPPLDPGDEWQTVSIHLNRKSTLFSIIARDQSAAAWVAFSMPAISGGHAPGRWARSLANGWLPRLDRNTSP